MTTNRMKPTKLWAVISPDGSLIFAGTKKTVMDSITSVYYEQGKNGKPRVAGRDRIARVLVTEVIK